MNANSTPEQQRHLDDEIDLRDLILPLIRGKWLIILSAILCVMLVATYHLGRYAFNYPEEYAVTVAFQFSSPEPGQYPNGQAFSANDLIAGNIVRDVYLANSELQEFASYADFANQLRVDQGFTALGIFESQVVQWADSDRKVTVEQFNERVANYMDVLRQASTRTATVVLDNSKLKLPENVARKIMVAIPQAWASYAVNNRGVLNKFPAFSPEAVAVDVEGQDAFVVINVLDDIARETAEILSEFSAEPGASSFIVPETLISVTDLRTELDLLRKYRILLFKNLITNQINSLGSQIGGLRQEMMQARLQQLNSRESELVRLITVYEDSIDQFDKLSDRRVPSDSSNPGGTTIYSPQYNESFVNTMLELGSKLADPEFRKDLISEKISISTELEQVRTEIDLFTDTSTGSQNTLRLETINAELEDIKAQLSAIRDNTVRLINAYNTSLNSNSSSLYQSLGDVEAVAGYQLINESIFKILAAALVLGLFLGVLLVFLRSMLKN